MHARTLFEPPSAGPPAPRCSWARQGYKGDGREATGCFSRFERLRSQRRRQSSRCGTTTQRTTQAEDEDDAAEDDAAVEDAADDAADEAADDAADENEE